MTLIDHIDDIRNKLKENAYKDEAAVSIQIVNRLLVALNWPTYSPEIFIPEYSVDNKRVDFALCHPEKRPIIFIEVKQVGKIDGAEEQLFNYAFHEGVPILVLTDGRKWRFFHPAGTGNYQERLVIEIDLLTGKGDEVSSDLNRYLNYEEAKSGNIINAIREDYEKVADERLIQEGLPKAWNQLINQVDDSLVNIIAEKTKEISGKLPTLKQVIDFLINLSSSTSDGKIQ